MIIHIVIPTKNRLKKLVNCVRTIEIAIDEIKSLYDNIKLYIYSNSEDEIKHISNEFKDKEFIIPSLLTVEYNASSFWNSHIRQYKPDILFYLNDDVLLDKNCLNEALKYMRRFFRNNDGVIGINQANAKKGQALEAAFGAIGINYASRFPNYNLFCEDYKRFYGDRELDIYSKSINKFKFCRNAKLIHLHPCFTEEKGDETHFDVRKHLGKDKETFLKRQELGYLWGKDSYLINDSKKENI